MFTNHYLHPLSRPKETIEQNGEYDQSKSDIHTIALYAESNDGKRNASNGRSDEKEQAKLDQAPSPTMPSASDNSGNRAEFRGLSAEDPVTGCFVGMMCEVDARSREDNSRRQHHSDPEQIAEDHLHLTIVPGLRRRRGMRLWNRRIGRRHQLFPPKPW